MQKTYLEFVRSSKSTNIHRLPFINFIKNSASELFCIDHATAYQHAFGYIRQLGIHLRNSMKAKTKVCSLSLLLLYIANPVRLTIGSIQTGIQLAIRALRRFLVSGVEEGM